MKITAIAVTITLSVMSGAKPASAPATTTAPTTTTTTLVSAVTFSAWEKVAWCETHGDWSHYGAQYDGGLGIMPVNWVAYGGLEFAPSAHEATPQQQVLIATRINEGYPIPDQDGTCTAW